MLLVNQSSGKQRLKNQIQHEVSCTDVHIVTAGGQLGLSRERGAGARWQEIIHLVDSRGPWTERGKQEPSGRQRKVGKVGISCVQM